MQKGAKTKKEEANKKKRQRKVKWTELASKNEQHKPSFLKDLFLSHKYLPMIEDNSKGNSTMEMVITLQLPKKIPFFHFTGSNKNVWFFICSEKD